MHLRPLSKISGELPQKQDSNSGFILQEFGTLHNTPSIRDPRTPPRLPISGTKPTSIGMDDYKTPGVAPVSTFSSETSLQNRKRGFLSRFSWPNNISKCQIVLFVLIFVLFCIVAAIGGFAIWADHELHKFMKFAEHPDAAIESAMGQFTSKVVAIAESEYHDIFGRGSSALASAASSIGSVYTSAEASIKNEYTSVKTDLAGLLHHASTATPPSRGKRQRTPSAYILAYEQLRVDARDLYGRLNKTQCQVSSNDCQAYYNEVQNFCQTASNASFPDQVLFNDSSQATYTNFRDFASNFCAECNLPQNATHDDPLYLLIMSVTSFCNAVDQADQVFGLNSSAVTYSTVANSVPNTNSLPNSAAATPTNSNVAGVSSSPLPLSTFTTVARKRSPSAEPRDGIIAFITAYDSLLPTCIELCSILNLTAPGLYSDTGDAQKLFTQTSSFCQTFNASYPSNVTSDCDGQSLYQSLQDLGLTYCNSTQSIKAPINDDVPYSQLWQQRKVVCETGNYLVANNSGIIIPAKSPQGGDCSSIGAAASSGAATLTSTLETSKLGPVAENPTEHEFADLSDASDSTLSSVDAVTTTTQAQQIAVSSAVTALGSTLTTTPASPGAIGSYTLQTGVTIPMITFTDPALYTSVTTNIPTAATSELYSLPTSKLANTWGYSMLYPQPLGYAAPSVVPATAIEGELTFYNSGTGACGEYISPNEFGAAINWQLYDFSGGSNSALYCNRSIKAWREADGQVQSADLYVRDRCTGCRPQDLDIEPAIFAQVFTATAVGRISVTWSWNAPTGAAATPTPTASVAARVEPPFTDSGAVLGRTSGISPTTHLEQIVLTTSTPGGGTVTSVLFSTETTMTISLPIVPPPPVTSVEYELVEFTKEPDGRVGTETVTSWA